MPFHKRMPKWSPVQRRSADVGDPLGRQPLGLAATQLLTTAEAVERLGLSPRTVEMWRITGDGPRYRKLGRRAVRYAESELAAFAAANTRDSTSRPIPGMERVS